MSCDRIRIAAEVAREIVGGIEMRKDKVTKPVDVGSLLPRSLGAGAASGNRPVRPRHLDRAPACRPACR